jgi:N-acetylglucosamine-6-phosphate deacetylase
MNSFSLSANKVVTSSGVIEDAFVNVSGETITGISKEPYFDRIIDYSNQVVVPGFIDIHTHGYFGIDAVSSNETDIRKWASAIARKGVTSFIPTCVSLPKDQLINFIKKIDRLMRSRKSSESRIIGARSEGPFISMEKRGAHNPEFVRKISMDEVNEIIVSSNNALKIVDMAPELNLFNEAMSRFQSAGTMVSVGHSNADFATASLSLASGVRLMTHFYNAMTKLDHREPGMVGAGLLSQNAFLEIISDFHHVSKHAIEIVSKMRGWDHIIAVTDSLSIGGTEEENSSLGGVEIEMHDGVVWIKGTRTIAGSVLTLEQAFMNLCGEGVSLCDCIKALSTNPASLMGLNDRGDIAAGKIADINILDRKLNVIKTIIGGNFLD